MSGAMLHHNTQQESASKNRTNHPRCPRDFRNEGYQGNELFEKVASQYVDLKEQTCSNRCVRCWHDRVLRCICPLVPDLADATLLPVKVLILMHYKEYLSAGDDAKLLLAMLPAANAELFVFGKEGEWERFEMELSEDPIHTLTLWPGEGAQTLDAFVKERLPKQSPWRQHHATATTSVDADVIGTSSSNHLPMLRVIVLDGVYSQARNMFKTMRKKLNNDSFPPFVALHPDTLSVYHRAQKSYGASSAITTAASQDPKALHICTVEAYALLLKELGESTKITDPLVKAVVVNNDALRHRIHVRPEGGKPTSTSSGAARRRRKKLVVQEGN